MKSQKICEKYGIAITNYVLGEDLGMPPEELYNHLRNCPKCLDELTDWQETYAVMRTEAYHKTPEAKQRYEELLEKIKHLPAEQSTDVKVEIDTAAGKIQKVLKTHGQTPILELRQKTGLVDYPFYEAISWLVMNDKAVYTKGQDNRPCYVSPR